MSEADLSPIRLQRSVTAPSPSFISKGTNIESGQSSEMLIEACEAEAALLGHLRFLLSMIDSPLGQEHVSSPRVLNSLLPLIDNVRPKARRLLLTLFTAATSHGCLDPAAIAAALPTKRNNTSSGVGSSVNIGIDSTKLPLPLNQPVLSDDLGPWLLGMLGRLTMAHSQAVKLCGTGFGLSEGNSAGVDSVVNVGGVPGLGRGYWLSSHLLDLVGFVHELLRDVRFPPLLLPPLRDALARACRQLMATGTCDAEPLAAVLAALGGLAPQLRVGGRVAIDARRSPVLSRAASEAGASPAVAEGAADSAGGRSSSGGGSNSSTNSGITSDSAGGGPSPLTGWVCAIVVGLKRDDGIASISFGIGPSHEVSIEGLVPLSQGVSHIRIFNFIF